MLIAITALASCNKGELQPNDNPNFERVVFNVVLDDTQTRAGVPTEVTRYIMEVYSDAEATQPVNCFDYGDTKEFRAVNADGKFNAKLDKTKPYTILVWADNGDAVTANNSDYNAENLRAISLNAGKKMAEHAYYVKTKHATVDQNEVIILDRAVAKLVFNQKGGYFNNDAQTVTVTYPETYTFNCNGGTTTSTATERFVEMAATPIYKEVLLGADYVFAPAAAVINIKVGVNSESITKDIANVPIGANKSTKITGQYSVNMQSTQFEFESDDWSAESEFTVPIETQYNLDKGEQGKAKRANSYIIPLTASARHILSI